MNQKNASIFLIFLGNILIQVILCSSLTVKQKLIVAENSIHKYRSTVEHGYLSDVYSLFKKSDELQISINNTVNETLENLFKAMSYVEKAREFVAIVSPDGIPAEYITELQQNSISSDVKLVNEIRREYYSPVETFTLKLAALVNLIYVNSNYSSAENLRFCLVEPLETKAVSCLEDNVRSYAEYLSRLKMAVKKYSDDFRELETDSLNETKSKLKYVFTKSEHVKRNIINEILNYSNLTYLNLVNFTNFYIASNRENANELIHKTKTNINEYKNILKKHNNELHNYFSVFSNIQNILNISVEIILKDNLNETFLDCVVDENRRFKDHSLSKLLAFINDTFSKVHEIEESLNNANETLETVNETFCDRSDITELTSCLYEQVSVSSEEHDRLVYLLNITSPLFENLDENIEAKIQNIYNQFSIAVQNSSEAILLKYNMKYKDIYKYELNKIESAKKELIQQVFNIEVNNRKHILEYKSKVNNFRLVFDIFSKLLQTIENEHKTKAITQLDVSVLAIFSKGEDSVLGKINDIELYGAKNKCFEFFQTFKKDNLKLSCKNDAKNGFTIVESLQCFESERTRFSHFAESLLNDYVQSYRELDNIVSLLFYDIQHAMHVGIKTCVSVDSGNDGNNKVLECLHNMDFRKFTSLALKETVLVCSSLLDD